MIAAVCLEHGVSEILTEDTDFHRIPGITVRRLAAA
jgi:predicted nucleic acid-binding protein